MDVKIESITVGSLEVNCYIVYDAATGEAMVIDPGDEPDRIMEVISGLGLKVKYIVCTHTHFDHVGAVPEVKRATGAKIVIHSGEKDIYEAAKDMGAFWGYELEDLPAPDMLVKEGDTIEVGDAKFTVFHTPGHSPGGICLYGEELLITGDTIFAGSVGRTDFHGGSLHQLKESFRRILALPEGTDILPGHGPVTTVGEEKRGNFFISEL